MKGIFITASLLLSTSAFSLDSEKWNYPEPKIVDTNYKTVSVVKEKESDDPANNTYGVSEKTRLMASEEEKKAEVKRDPSSINKDEEMKSLPMARPAAWPDPEPRYWNIRGKY